MIGLARADARRIPLAAGSVDLTVTSPPYDNMRDYDGYQFEHEPVIRELWRVTKPGGVVVWVVADQTIDGSESGTSFRQALFFMGCGFNLHDTMIYEKNGQGASGSELAYWQDFDYMFVFSKGRPRRFNPIEDRKNIERSKREFGHAGHRKPNGDKKGWRVIHRREYGRRMNIWTFHETSTRLPHPAVFPEALARDHILSWSKVGDLVLDPMCGSGTTGKMAKELGRHFVGLDISAKYIRMSERRIQGARVPLPEFT